MLIRFNRRTWSSIMSSYAYLMKTRTRRRYKNKVDLGVYHPEGGVYYSSRPEYKITPLLDLIDQKHGILHKSVFKEIWRTGYRTNGSQWYYTLLVGDGNTILDVHLQWWDYQGY